MIGERWTFYAVEMMSGDVIMDLPLVGFSGTVSLAGGEMSATVPLIDLDQNQRQDILNASIPGRYSILGMRDDVVAGEWLIWQRTRNNDEKGVSLAGSEVVKFLERRVMVARTYSQVEQFQIASDLITAGFGASPHGNGAVAMSIAPHSASGVKRDRTYVQADGTIYQRLKELSEVIDGFDFYIAPTITGIGIETVSRAAHLAYPRAGSDQGLIIETAGHGYGPGGGNVLAFSFAEDGRELASGAYTIGQDMQSYYEDDALITVGRYPYLEKSASYSTVTDKATLDKYAQSLWTESQRFALPGDVTILADSSPGFGSFALGDIVTVVLEESFNFPLGARMDVRVLGWSFNPPDSGPETMSLSIVQEGPLNDYSGNPIP